MKTPVLLLLATQVLAQDPGPTDHERPLYLKDSSGVERAIPSAAGWQGKRARILQGMESVMGPFREPGKPAPGAAVPLDLEVIAEERLQGVVRRKVVYTVEPGDRVSAYLLLPEGMKNRAPAVLCLHQTTDIGKEEPAGLGGKESLHCALHLARRGYVTLAPDYPNFGEHRFATYEKGYASGSMKAIRDNCRAVDLLQSLPEVDGDRIGCLGHSLGGHNALFTAVFEPRIKVIVTNCAFNAFRHYYGGNLKGWSSGTYMPRIALLGGWRAMPFDFHEVVAALAPRPFLAIAPVHDANFAVEGVREVLASAREVYQLLGAGDRLEVSYPDCEHDFPPASRELAYGWLDRWLRADLPPEQEREPAGK